jgi:hypothetical protein
MGGYVKRCMGLNLYFKVENPKNKRIQEFFIGNRRINRSKTYSACFVTEQGIPAKYGTNHQTLDIRAIDALKSYLEKYDGVSEGLRRTIVPV